MAKKSSKPKGNASRRKGVAVNAWVNEKLAAAFKRYLDSLEVRPTTTRAVEAALKEYLQKRGFWPPADDPTLD